MEKYNKKFIWNGRYYIEINKCIKTYARYLMEEYLGRRLNDDEIVHHKDGNKLNDIIENLEINDKKVHLIYHNKRNNNPRYINISKDELLKAINICNTFKELSEKLNISVDTVKTKLKKFNIEFKSRQYELMRGKNNPMYKYNIDFSGKNNPFFGKKHSEENKKIIGKNSSNCLKGRTGPDSNRYINN